METLEFAQAVIDWVIQGFDLIQNFLDSTKGGGI